MTNEETAQDLYNRLTEDGAADVYDFAVCPTRTERNGPYFKQDVVAALVVADFVLIKAAQLLGRSRGRLREYVMKNPDLVDLYNDYRQGMVDMSERNVLKSAAFGKDTADARYVLSTLGKDRGYSTRSEVTGANGDAIQIVQQAAAEALDRLKKLGSQPSSSDDTKA